MKTLQDLFKILNEEGATNKELTALARASSNEAAMEEPANAKK